MKKKQMIKTIIEDLGQRRLVNVCVFTGGSDPVDLLVLLEVLDVILVEGTLVIVLLQELHPTN